MTHIERFYNTVNRKKTDRPAWWLGIPVEASHNELFKYFKVSNINELKQAINDDIWDVSLPYDLKNKGLLCEALNFTKPEYINEAKKGSSLTLPGFFEDYEDADAIDLFNWPNPEQFINKEDCLNSIKSVPKDYPIMAVMWEANFQDACSAFGMEKSLMNMMLNPEFFEAVLSKITDFYMRANEIYFEYLKGKLDVVLIGNDLGTQISTIASPNIIREMVFPNIKKLVTQIKSYDIKVLFHSCGSIFELIPDLIEIGVDIINPLQAKAKNMQIDNIKRSFYGKVSFCGGVDAQDILVTGTPEDVYKEVIRIKEIFPTGLIISPSHEAILPDISPANIEALMRGVVD